MKMFSHRCATHPGPDRSGPGIPRRSFVAGSVGGLLSLFLKPFDLASGVIHRGGGKDKPARSIIILWLSGGPSHVDTFDPKKGHRDAGRFRPIRTSVPGVELCEHLPRTAEIAHKLAIVRSMTSEESSHFRGTYLVQTGYSPGSVRHPALGSVVSKVLGDPKEALPPFVTVGGTSFGPGILGESFAPLHVAEAGVPIENVAPAPGVDLARSRRRVELAGSLEERWASSRSHPEVERLIALRKRSLAFMSSPRLSVFDLSPVPAKLRDAYGRNPFGQGCLLARRLVEEGIRCVEVTCGGWDTHTDVFGGHEKALAIFDPAFSTLIRDLEERELLDSTLVLVMGEFGRTPDINPRDGRDHYSKAFFSVLAGSGIRTGIVHGQTDERGAEVVTDPVTVPDLVATLCLRLGINTRIAHDAPTGRPVRISEGAPVRKLLAT